MAGSFVELGVAQNVRKTSLTGITDASVQAT